MEFHAELIKLIIAYTLVGAFVFTVAITCLSLIGFVRFANPRQQSNLFAVLIVELVIIGLGSFSDLLELNPADARRAIQEPLKTELVEQRAVTQQVASRAQEAAMEGLRPQAVTMARALIDAARRRGIELRVISGYRSPQQQQDLYARGRTRPGPVITNARVSVHNTGLAFDVAVVENGGLSFDEEELREVGRIGQEVGLVWGGASDRFPDLPHFETPDAQAVLRDMLSS